MSESKSSKNKRSIPAGTDDVGRLFARLGSTGAEGYWDFEPSRLPVREPAAPPALPEPMAVEAAPTAAPETDAEADADAQADTRPQAAPEPRAVPSILATIHPLRAEAAPRPVAIAAAGTPLAEMFQRLLKAESPPLAAGPLRRMFSR